jgi:AraC-like DNA-binding protein
MTKNVPARRSPWNGVLTMGPWWLLYAGDYGPTNRHSHHAVQIIVSTAPVKIRCNLVSEIEGPVVVVPANLAHEVSSHGFATMLFLDADSVKGRRLTARCAGAPFSVFLSVELVGSSELSAAAVLSLVDGDTESAPWPAPGKAVASVLSELADDPGAGSLAEFAARAELSPSRFSQRFTREVGTPLRSYRRWVRMLQAVEALSAGATLTSAAHCAGFTDSAHLTHTFRDCFGIAPSDLLGASRFAQLH